MLIDRQFIEDMLLPRVEKPSRYIGQELNSVHKDPAEVDVRLCLAFPDMYDLGLSNLGLLILYSLLNKRPGIWCERVYSVGVDLEQELRARDIPLFSVESCTPLDRFDAVGFTLQYELSYTNILNILQLGRIPILASEREDRHPIILAGGPCAFNPEPLADFIDCFVLGDGEDAIVEVAEVLKETRGLPREQRLEALTRVKGAYVPALYPTATLADGTVVGAPGVPPVRKALLLSLEKTPYPTDYIVPFTQQVHDRVSLEVLRGCTQGCRFCQAGMIYRPVRERNIDTLADLMRETIQKTGYEEISLSSLSTCDYSKPKALVASSVLQGAPDNVAVSLPSLRMDTFSVDLVDMVQSVRKTGVTFAPEAATPRMRAVIDKDIPDDMLFETTEKVYSMGWDHVKLYFMVGLPTERDEDVLRIAFLAQEVLRRGRRVNSRASLRIGVSTFVPKPHTPFQWDRQIDVEETLHKQRLLHERTRAFGLKFGRHDAEMSFLEGVLSRGDRRLGRLILEAYRLGSRFDGWHEHMNLARWQAAAENTGLDLGGYLRERSLDEPLPWDHIDTLVEKQYHVKEYIKSRMEMLNRDCRYSACSTCGVITEEKNSCVEMLSRQKKGLKEEKTWARPELPEQPPQTPAMRLQARFARTGSMRLLSHKETINVWCRALRRAGIRMCYSEGFHPQPRLAFSSGLAVGLATRGDYIDVLLLERVAPEEFRLRANQALPPGFEVLAAGELPLSAPSLMAAIVASEYELELPPGAPAWDPAELLARETIDVQRRTKKGDFKTVDIRPLLTDFRLLPDGRYRLAMRNLGELVGKPGEAVELLPLTDEQRDTVKITRLSSLIERDGKLVEVETLWLAPRESPRRLLLVSA
ncbi:MAG: TIGR03960 family B12-binding radical SAM protein [Candidatus Eremiobacterota bacterium]